MQNKLKPCPFCGGEGTFSTSELLGLSSNMSFYVVCDTCECSTSYEDTGNEAVKKWNTRQPAFDWKPIEELSGELLTGITSILLYKNIDRYVLPNIWVIKGEAFISENTYENKKSIEDIQKQYTRYTLLTPPQTNQNGN